MVPKVRENVAQKWPWSDEVDYALQETEVPKTGRIFGVPNSHIFD